MSEMVAVSEKILGQKIGVKNLKMGTRWEKLEWVKILGWKIGVKNSSRRVSKMETFGKKILSRNLA